MTPPELFRYRLDFAEMLVILNQLVKYQTTSLDSAFNALADPTRRSMLTRLSQGSATISELSKPHAMSLPAASKHVRVLEDAGLVERAKEGRSWRCRLVNTPLVDAAQWLKWLESFWAGQLEGLEDYVRELEAADAVQDKAGKGPASRPANKVVKGTEKKRSKR